MRLFIFFFISTCCYANNIYMIKEHDTSWMTDKQYAYYCQIKNNMIQIKNSAHQIKYQKKIESDSNTLSSNLYNFYNNYELSDDESYNGNYVSSGNSNRVQVRSYTRKNGTVVKAHSRSAPKRR